MPSFTHIPKQSYKRLSWKNGLGFTDEIAIYPKHADLRRGDFLWRLSSAKIDASSSFSTFPAHDRILMVLQGAGVRLSHCFEEGQEEETVEILPLNPYEFPGDVPSRCELISGSITDLSVFVRKAEVDALVDVVKVDVEESFKWIPAGRWNFLFAAQGDFQVNRGGQALAELKEGDTFSVMLNESLPEHQSLLIRPSRRTGQLVTISFQADHH